jgi:subtilisin family serine protease
MAVYIIRPKLSASPTLTLAARPLSPESRVEQIQRVKQLREQDPLNQEIRHWVESTRGAQLVTPAAAPNLATGTTLATMSDEQAQRLGKQMPELAILKDRPISLIDPIRTATAGPKPSLSARDLWHLEAIGLATGRAGKRLKETGDGVTVAVLDTGIDATHTEVADRVAAAYTFDRQSWKEQVQAASADTHGHGTHVAGLLAGRTVGVAPGARLVSGVMLPKGRGQLSDFILALEWAALQPQIQIINVSAGLRGYEPAMRPVVSDLLALGVLPVIAIGNEGANQTRSPGNYPEVVSVGAVDRDRKVWASSGGAIMTPEYHQYPVPALVAPGDGVFSCVKGGGYVAWSGTSMAAPIVSGVAALILERHRTITVAQLKEELLACCEDLGLPVERQGSGLIRADSALSARRQAPKAERRSGRAGVAAKARGKSASGASAKPTARSSGKAPKTRRRRADET